MIKKNLKHVNTVIYQSLKRVSSMPQGTLDKSSRQHNIFSYHTSDRGNSNRPPRCWEVRALTTRPSSFVKVECGNIPDTLVPVIYVIMAIPLKCVAILFRMSPEGITTLSTIKASNEYLPCHRLLWINPAAKITFSVITLETAGITTVNPNVGR